MCVCEKPDCQNTARGCKEHIPSVPPALAAIQALLSSVQAHGVQAFG